MAAHGESVPTVVSTRPPAPQGGGGRPASGFPPARGLLPLALGLGAWQVAGSPSSPYFPPPSTWWPALVDLWQAGGLPAAAASSLTALAVGLGAATVLGTTLGLLVGARHGADRALGPTLEFVRAMPPAALVPVAALLIGYNDQMKVTLVTLAAMWPILFNVRAGVRGLDPVLLDAVTSLHVTGARRIRKVLLPALAPGVFLGLRVAAPLALVITLLVEFITRLDGLGALIAAAQRSYLSAEVWGLVLVAGLLSVLVSGAIALLETVVLRHRPR